MLGKILVSRYKISEELGRGGFGQTFIAEDMHLPGHPKCVIKQLKPRDTHTFVLESARKLFDREAQTLYKLGNHSQIPSLLAHFEYETEFYLAQEMIEGNVLSREITSGKQLNEAYVLWLLQEVLEVLAFVHTQNVIHRDIKPSNLIKRFADGKIVLIDFGAVKETSLQTSGSQEHTSITVTIGSPGYMPDEQANGRPKFASDIYATGMMCIHALTGVTPSQMPEDQKTGEIVWRDLVPHLNSELANFLDKMTRPHFSQRFQNGTEALLALQDLQRADAFSTTIIPSQPMQAAIASINESDQPNSTIVLTEPNITPVEQPSTVISPDPVVSEPPHTTITVPKFVAAQNALQGTTVSKQDDPSVTNVAEKPIASKLQVKKPFLIIAAIIAVIAAISSHIVWKQSEDSKRLAQEIELIKGLKGSQKYQECSDRAKAISSSAADTPVQSLLKECLNGLSEIEGKAQLTEAQKLVKQNKLKEAIAIATKINPNSSVYAESQKLIDQWSQQLLGIATKKYQEEGQLKEAIALLQEIPLNTPTGRKVTALTNEWQMQFEKESKALALAKTALSQARWNDAILESNKVKLPFLRIKATDITNQARAEIIAENSGTYTVLDRSPLPQPETSVKSEPSITTNPPITTNSPVNPSSSPQNDSDGLTTGSR